MPCRVPKRRFSCGAPQHLTKNLNKNQLPCLTLSVETGELFIFLPSKMKYDANHGSCSKPDHRVDLFELRRKDEQYSCQ